MVQVKKLQTLGKNKQIFLQNGDAQCQNGRYPQNHHFEFLEEKN